MIAQRFSPFVFHLIPERCRVKKMTKSNIANAFRMHFNMMHISGVWPDVSPSLLYRVRGVISWLLGVILLITMTMEVLNDLSDFTRLSEILYIMVSVATYLVKLAGFTYQRKTFLRTVKFLKDPVFVSYPDEMDHYMAKTIKTSTLIATSYGYLCLCCMIMFAVYPALDNKPLPFPFPYKLDDYCKYIMYVFQVAAISNSAWNNSCLDTLLTSLMGIGAAELDILMEKIILVGKGEKKEAEVIKELKQCVQHHMATIEFIESIEKIFTVGLLSQFLASVIVICNTVFHFVLISAMSFQFGLLANYFAIMISQLTMYCWYGNEIMLKSVQIGEACYKFNWYNYGERVGVYLLLMMERSKRPLTITALKFSKLSLHSLTSILQWSYSYLTLLLQMYKKNS